MHFSDPNFRLACLDILRDQGLLRNEIDQLAIEPIPASQRLESLAQLTITPAMLSGVTDFAPDGGDDIYFIADPEWNGEDDSLYISRFDDIALLPNLRSLYVQAVTKPNALELSWLLSIDTLENVDINKFYLADNANNVEIVSELTSNGVSVSIS